VSKSFGGLAAVQDVSLELAAGSLSALIGPNGAGKTTLFALMSGFLRPDAGSIEFAGADVTGQPPHLNARRGMTRTFQIVQPFAAQTVRENIAVGVHLHCAGRTGGARRGGAGSAARRPRAAAGPARRRADGGGTQAAGARPRARDAPAAAAARRSAGGTESAGNLRRWCRWCGTSRRAASRCS
jgi:ABC-type sugar transport system ATPase subunit